MMTSGAVRELGIIQVTECVTRQNAVNEKKNKIIWRRVIDDYIPSINAFN